MLHTHEGKKRGPQARGARGKPHRAAARIISKVETK